MSKPTLCLLLVLVWTWSHSSAEEPRRPAPAELTEATKLLERILRENIIPFWYPQVIDLEGGGYRLNHDLRGKWLGPSQKHLVTQARTVWFFSRLARSKYGSPKHLEAARHGYEFLRDRMWDRDHEGFFWAVDASGAEPRMPQKHLYGQAFGLYALSEYYRASASPEAEKLARKLFGLLESRAHDKEHGGYRESFLRDWSAPPADSLNYMNVASDLKLMNTHLHLMEALTTYHAATQDALARERLIELVFVESNSVVRKDVGACTDRYRRNWTPLRGPTYDRVSFGHDIENVWLLIEASNVAGLPHALLSDLHRTLFGYSLRYGYDSQNGGFFDSGPIDAPADRRQKVWWVEAECMVSALWMFRLTRDPVYFSCFSKTLDWIAEHQVDWEHGDWYGEIAETGEARGSKAGAWKSPYHNGRAVIRCLELLDTLSDTPPK